MAVSAGSPPGTSTKFGRFEIRKMRLEVNLAQVRETKLKRRYSYKYRLSFHSKVPDHYGRKVTRDTRTECGVMRRSHKQIFVVSEVKGT